MKSNSENNSLLKQPSAWIPITISLAALAFLIVYVAVFGISNVPNAEEEAPARVFQILMMVQLPVIAYFALKWLPKQPKQTLLILALQAIAWIIPIVTVILLESL